MQPVVETAGKVPVSLPKDATELAPMSESTTATVTETQTVPAEAGAVETKPENVVLDRMTDAERKTLETAQASEDKLVRQVIAFLSPKNALKKYAEFGDDCRTHVLMVRDKVLRQWNGMDDLKKICSQLETKIRMRVPATDLRLITWIKVGLWFEKVKAINPKVENLSYHVVANKLLPTLEFDANYVTGDLRQEWVAWLTQTVERQVSDDPMSMKELDESIERRKSEIAAEKAAKKDPEKAREQEIKAAAAKNSKARQKSQSAISDAINTALVESHTDPADLVKIAEAVLKDHNLELPKPVVNPIELFGDMGIAECKLLCDVLYKARKLAEMKYLRDRLDVMVKTAENALVKTDAA